MSRWFRFYDDAFDNPKVASLSDHMFRVWMRILCIASKNDGKLGQRWTLAARLVDKKCRSMRYITALIDMGLLDEIDGELTPHNWFTRQYKSDSSRDRVRAYRERKRNANVTLHVTAPDTEQKESLSFFPEAAREKPRDPPSGGSLATALPTGALARPPRTKPKDARQGMRRLSAADLPVSPELAESVKRFKNGHYNGG